MKPGSCETCKGEGILEDEPYDEFGFGQVCPDCEGSGRRA